MKATTYHALIFMLLFFIPTLKGQKNTRTYNVWVRTMHEPKVSKGFIHSVEDSSIVIILQKGNNLKDIEVSKIHKIMIRRKNRVLKGASIGAASGILFGALIGFADGDDEPGFLSASAETKAAGGAIALLPIGAGLGAAIGSGKKRFPIEGDITIYSKYKSELKQYTIH